MTIQTFSAGERAIFFELHSAMPRQGPGNRASTHKALALCLESNPAPATVLDIGCGPGLQTIHLAERLPNAKITGIDLLPAMINEAVENANAAGSSERVSFELGDMSELNCSNIDLIWSEGAAYNMGVQNALKLWRQFLNHPGHIAFTDAVFLDDNRPKEVADFWLDYPDMQTVTTRCAQAEALGFEVTGHFVLSEDAWWDDYYQPLQQRIDTLRDKYHDNVHVTPVLDYSQSEIDLYKRFSSNYGYGFFILRQP